MTGMLGGMFARTATQRLGQAFLRGANADLGAMAARAGQADVAEVTGFVTRQATENYVDQNYKKPAETYMRRTATTSLYSWWNSPRQ